MRHSLRFTIPFLALIIYSFSLRSKFHPDEGRILCLEYNNVDLGERFLNDNDTFCFPFTNCSDDTVQIQNIGFNNKGSCPYHIMNYVKLREPIPPGKKDSIIFYRYNYTEVEPGLKDYSFTIHFENMHTKQYLNIFTEFRENMGELKVEPVLVDTVERGREVKFSARIFNDGSDPVTLTKLRSIDNNLELLSSLPMKVKAGESKVLNFDLKTEEINKKYRSTVEIATNGNGRSPRLSIPYSGYLISDQEPEITFDSLVQTAYRCKGEGLQYEFWFENTGNVPLIISCCKTSCGCLVATWPKEPIAPGERGVIKIRYDTNRIGPINKSCTVQSNAPGGLTILRVKGNVKVCDEQLPENR